MQPKFQAPKSNIIKLTQEAKRQSRQALIGSIILLICALIVLLTISSKPNKDLASPKLVLVNKSNNLQLDTKIEGPLITQPEESVNLTNKVIPSTKIEPSNQNLTINNESSNAAPQTIDHNNTSVTTANKDNKLALTTNRDKLTNKQFDTKKPLSQDIATNKPQKNKPDPLAILNGLEVPDLDKKTNLHQKFIQFAALSSLQKAQKYQQNLVQHGVKAQIETVTTHKGVLYRLRAGPYSNAQEKAKQLEKAGFTVMISN